MTALRTTSSPTWWLPRFKRAALPGLTLFFAVAISFASAANADTVTASSTTTGSATASSTTIGSATAGSTTAADTADKAPVSTTAAKPVTTANAATPPPASTTPHANATDSANRAVGDSSADNGTQIAVEGFSLHHLRWDYKEADFFKRISEYFSGRESTGYRLILRTDPQQRAGLYFQASLSAPISELPAGSALVVRYVRPDKAEATVTHTFELPDSIKNSNKTQLWLGFTGADTPADKTPPTAWQVSVVDAAGKQLAEVHSFLWSPRNARAN